MATETSNVTTGAGVRRKFLDYFVSKGHTEAPSASLVPNDPTLLFTNAGMVPFKDVFTCAEKRPYSRATSSQKCLRVSGKHNDLETVGRTARHHTFFEMLGNFSFGDYFKEQAIEYGWEFLTEVMGLPAARLHVTVFTDDDDAAAIWERTIGLPPEKITRLGEKDNFWSMGDTGPCGPCSEIHYDRGAEHACGNPDCGVDCECDRFLELWNLVFMQFDRDASGKLTPLPNPSIDTGLGLERLVSVIQNKRTNFDTDLILPVIRHMERLTDAVYEANLESDVSFRVIGDHMRATAFLIAEGIMPSNEGRGYVLRRIVRRALRHGRMLGVTEPFAHRLTETVVEIMKDAYPELADAAKVIAGVTLSEEESFSATLEHGMRLLDDVIDTAKANGKTVISGGDAFKLWDTYGFPMDLAIEVAEDAGMTIDMDGYNRRMAKQQEKARASWKGAAVRVPAALTVGEPTHFTGYDEEATKTTVVAIVKNGEPVDNIHEGDEAEILLAASPFYAESGGQVGDTGTIYNDSFRATVIDTAKPDGARWAHKVTVDRGSVRPGEPVHAEVDGGRRQDIRRNHSATHLLHAALRQTLGAHVKQAGSLVAPDRLRFDYTHFTAPKPAELMRIERLVNEKVMQNLAVATKRMSMEEAVSSGAMALFEEKYGDNVRVVTMGDVSMELCGGTHTSATGDIGLFKLVSEGGVAAGVRRIEAVTGRGALEWVRRREEELAAISEALKTSGGDLPEKVRKQAERLKELEKENRKLKEKLVSGQAITGGAEIEFPSFEVKAKGTVFKVVHKKLDDVDAEALRTFIDNEKNRAKINTVVVVGTVLGDKALIAAGVTNDITDKIQAGKIIKELAAIVGGGGGGRPDFAQAGGKKPEKLKEALQLAPSIVEKIINE